MRAMNTLHTAFPAEAHLKPQIARRRTFAIISHPDAGKTTLTEKLLLFGGAIHLAGEVAARGERRRTRSDWMDIEKKRGISVSSSVMMFERDGIVFNLLDTPGPRGLLRGHLPHADRGGFGRHGRRRRQGHRGADPQAVRGLPPARHSDHHLHQQGGPGGARPVRADGRDRRQAGAGACAGHVARRHGRPVPRRLQPHHQRLSPCEGGRRHRLRQHHQALRRQRSEARRHGRGFGAGRIPHPGRARANRDAAGGHQRLSRGAPFAGRSSARRCATSASPTCSTGCPPGRRRRARSPPATGRSTPTSTR